MFVSPHGFGHAARAAAAMAAVRRRRPGTRFELFTTVPRWFFEDSVGEPFGWHPIACDVGLVQRSAIEEDPAATAAALDRFYPFDAERLRSVADRLIELDCGAVVADISPLGLAAAEAAGLPSILVENFTWDWIYRPYAEAEPALGEFAEGFQALFDGATRRVQTEPVCRPRQGAVTTSPVSRRPRAGGEATRSTLGVGSQTPVVLLTMGGLSWSYRNLHAFERGEPMLYVVVGGVDEVQRDGSVLRLPDRSPLFVRDLVDAADVVVGKLGYSTVAEAAASGARYLFVARPAFPESPVLASFVRSHLPALEVSIEEFESGEWVERLPALLAEERSEPTPENGDDRVAEEIIGYL